MPRPPSSSATSTSALRTTAGGGVPSSPLVHILSLFLPYLLSLTGGSNPFFSLSLPHSLPPHSYWWVQPFLQSVSPSLSSSLTSSVLLVGLTLSSVCLSLTLFLLTLTGGSNPFFSLSLPHSLPPLPPHSYWWVQPFLQSVSPSLSSSLASSLLLVGPALSSVCLSLTVFLPCLLTLTGGSSPFFSLSLPHFLPPLPPHSYWWVLFKEIVRKSVCIIEVSSFHGCQ